MQKFLKRISVKLTFLFHHFFVMVLLVTVRLNSLEKALMRTIVKFLRAVVLTLIRLSLSRLLTMMTEEISSCHMSVKYSLGDEIIWVKQLNVCL